jgi:hypothetical protein
VRPLPSWGGQVSATCTRSTCWQPGLTSEAPAGIPCYRRLQDYLATGGLVLVPAMYALCQSTESACHACGLRVGRECQHATSLFGMMGFHELRPR